MESGRVSSSGSQSNGKIANDTLIELAAADKRIMAITAAMPLGTCTAAFKEAYPDRFLDVGIAEEHAVSMAGGLAKQGMIPVVALYSTFLQRSYDMILQDICMLRLHAILAIDRAGLVGEDGETHHGLFDVGFLRQAPGLKILCPASCNELTEMLEWSVCQYDGPVAIRYPRGGDRDYGDSAWKTDFGEEGGICIHRTGTDVAIITYGTLLQNAMDAAEIMHKQGIEATVIRLLTISPLPVQQILSAVSEVSHIAIMEETCSGGIGDTLAYQLYKQKPGCRVDTFDFGNQYVTHGSVSELYKKYGLDGQSVAESIMGVHSL